MYENLDTDELLRTALDAIQNERNAEALTILKTLIERDPGNAFGHYLLAAEHMQLGMVDRAEDGFRRVVHLAPDFPIARFQLGQLYLVKGDGASAMAALAPLTSLPEGMALACYARGLHAAAEGDVESAIRDIRKGLGCEQEIPALAGDMQQLLGNLTAAQASDSGPSDGLGTAGATPLYLSNYGKAGA